MPTLDEEHLQTYRQVRKSSSYTLADHPQVYGGPMSALFAQLRQHILALGPDVHEEYLKLYIAYKAVTNFVDIVPQKASYASRSICPLSNWTIRAAWAGTLPVLGAGATAM